MVEDDALSHYHFVGIDPERVRPLHELVVQYREELLGNEVLQDLLLYAGRGLPRQRPASYCDIADAVWRRSEVAVHLAYLNHALDGVTQPVLVTFERELISPPGNDLVDPRYDPSMEVVLGRTSRGHDLARIEALQRQWLTAPEAEIVRSYKAALERSFAQFNLQFILGKVDRCKETPLFESWPETAYQQQIQRVFTPEAQHHLDNAYYNRATRLFRLAEPLWLQLSQSEFGRFFILSGEEVLAGVASTYGRRA